MKTIMAPTDFSPVSLNAVAYAAEMANAINANLDLIHICPIPMAFSEVPFPPLVIDNMIQEGENRIQRIRNNLDKLYDGKLIITTTVIPGMIITELIAFCEALHPHAVVMGSQGSGAIERLVFGSVTLSAIKNLSSPLLVVPPGGKFETIKKIGIACDLKKVTNSFPIRQIRQLIDDFKAEFYVIHVNLGSEESYAPEILEETEVLKKILVDYHSSYHFLNNTGIDEGLTQFAERNGLDLLIVVPKKHNIIANIFHKSHSQQLALHSTVPIMAVHE
jgi:nucleotide-binding universal stress UspA family protein